MISHIVDWMWFHSFFKARHKTDRNKTTSTCGKDFSVFVFAKSHHHLRITGGPQGTPASLCYSLPSNIISLLFFLNQALFCSYLGRHYVTRSGRPCTGYIAQHSRQDNLSPAGLSLVQIALSKFSAWSFRRKFWRRQLFWTSWWQ